MRKAIISGAVAAAAIIATVVPFAAFADGDRDRGNRVKARTELERIGGRSPSGGALTPTERRVAGLVAEGLATKQVAAALFVSPKTVQGHLSRIYTKLGVYSRTELAHRLVSAADRKSPPIVQPSAGRHE
jgi:DNA-binding NarL/FixJ family response regulator